MSDRRRPFGLFEAYGVEIEYALVHRISKEILPRSSEALAMLARDIPDDALCTEPVEWVNELSAHVVEARCRVPAPCVADLLLPWKDAIQVMARCARALDASLLPGPVHPWMNPASDTGLWQGEGHEIYAHFNRVFDCSGHGWRNLQSLHLNLPFRGDTEFARLHAAVRVLLPLIPALAAASPFLDGRFTGWMDARMEAYRHHCRRIPSMVGDLIPEDVSSESEYHDRILGPMYTETAPHDPDGHLRHPWANARGAIARFDRGSIEIRVTDSQECPSADLAVADALAALTRHLVAECTCSFTSQRSQTTTLLAAQWMEAVRHGERARVVDSGYAALFGEPAARTLGELWISLFARIKTDRSWIESWRSVYAAEGTLARRMLAYATRQPTRSRLANSLDILITCLQDDVPFSRIRP